MTESTRTTIIHISIQLMALKGFNNTGIAEILALAKVPKGSFYHYFKSKDELGMAIIEHYGQSLHSSLSQHLQTASGTPLERLRSYFEGALVYFGDNFSSCNCLLGNLGQELALQDPLMRAAIFRHYRRIEQELAACLAQAKTQGELPSHSDEQLLAKMLFASWEGCLVRAKLEQSLQPLRELIELYFSTLFNRPRAH